jgi:hypothetical protein
VVTSENPEQQNIQICVFEERLQIDRRMLEGNVMSWWLVLFLLRKSASFPATHRLLLGYQM